MTSCTLVQHSAAELLAGNYCDLGYLGTINIVSAGIEFINV